MLAACRGQRRERCQRRLQEPAESDALAFALLADAVHPVVPVAGAEQRQAVLSDLQSMIDSSGTMLEKRLGLCRDLSHEECVMLLGVQRTAFEKRDLLVEYCRIAGCFDVLDGAVGEPDHIIADPGAHALTGCPGSER